METSANRLWCVPQHASLTWRKWGDEYVFHHALSNDTHRLSELSGQLVVYLATAGEHAAADLASLIGLNEVDAQNILEELAGLDIVACQ